jgi:acyl carrier protein
MNLDITEVTVYKIVQLIVDKLAVDQSELGYDISFTDDLGADSLDVYELLVGVENEFNITILDEDAEKLRTVGQLIEYADEKRVTRKLVSVSEM